MHNDLQELIDITRDHLKSMREALEGDMMSGAPGIEGRVAIALKAASLGLLGVERLAIILQTAEAKQRSASASPDFGDKGS